ncbi:DUF4432 family protein [Pararhizobium gei]|uniref:DUF4432 family protein n=1 Tax=Pararhizobium gei TaxID=1395951 RepID=UPI0023DA8F4E|nr:DUF4432 family protein [Rhizobium gei]
MPIRMSDDDHQFHMLLDTESALDIGVLFVDGLDLSPGAAIPSDGDPRIDHALCGFFFTCGPDHIRHPEPVDVEAASFFPLHGSLCGTPAALAKQSEDGRACSADIEVNLATGGRARLSRRWTLTRAGASLVDRVVNTGTEPFAPMLMYHMNIAGRLFTPDTRIAASAFGDERRHWRFGKGESAHFCLPAGADAEDGWAKVEIGPFDALAGRSLVVRFATATLPFLQMWRCQRGSADVVSIEPVSHRIAKRQELGARGELPMLAPGQAVGYAMSFEIR